MQGSYRGFTLVEAVVAIGIITSGMLAFAALAFQMTATVTWSRRQLTGAWLADAAVTARLAVPLTATAADCLAHDVAGCHEVVDGRGRPTTVGPAYVHRWRVAQVAPPPSAVWAVASCFVPMPARATAAPAPGACVARLVHTEAP